MPVPQDGILALLNALLRRIFARIEDYGPAISPHCAKLIAGSWLLNIVIVNSFLGLWYAWSDHSQAEIAASPSDFNDLCTRFHKTIAAPVASILTVSLLWAKWRGHTERKSTGSDFLLVAINLISICAIDGVLGACVCRPIHGNVYSQDARTTTQTRSIAVTALAQADEFQAWFNWTLVLVLPFSMMPRKRDERTLALESETLKSQPEPPDPTIPFPTGNFAEPGTAKTDNDVGEENKPVSGSPKTSKPPRTKHKKAA